MNRIITQSRYGDKRTIECVVSSVEKCIFKVYGKSQFCRQGEGMFDFEGGPCLMVGDAFYGLGTIAGLDTTKKPEDQDLDACVYVSVAMNKQPIKSKPRTKINKKGI